MIYFHYNRTFSQREQGFYGAASAQSGVHLVKIPATGENTTVYPFFWSAVVKFTQSSDLDFKAEKTKENLAKYMHSGSGWTLTARNTLEQIQTTRRQLLYTHLKGTHPKEGYHQPEKWRRLLFQVGGIISPIQSGSWVEVSKSSHITQTMGKWA